MRTSRSESIPFRRAVSVDPTPSIAVTRSRELRRALHVFLPFHRAPHWILSLVFANVILVAAYFHQSLPFDPILSYVGITSSAKASAIASSAAPSGHYSTLAAPGDAVFMSAEERAAAAFIAKRYRIAREAADLIVVEAAKASDEYRVDPFLLLALMARESSFNPFAESSVGALGLTQNLPEAHPEKISTLSSRGGHILDVRDNIRLGAQVLREYLDRFDGNETLALQQYNGALSDPSRSYSRSILALRDKIAESSR